MFIKSLFDRTASFFGLLFLSPILLVVAILIRIKMPDGPVIFTQRRVGQHGRLFTMYKFRSMTVGHGGSSVSVAGESRITLLGENSVSINWMSCLNFGMYWLAI